MKTTRIIAGGIAWVLLMVTVPVSSGASAASDLATLCDDYWQGFLRSHPTTATAMGDRRYDDRLEDITPTGIAEEKQRLEAILVRARALPEGELSTADRLTSSALIHEIEDRLGDLSCGFNDWVVDPLGGPQIDLLNLPDVTRIATVEDAKKFTTRCRAIGPYLDAHIANLRSGLGAGRTASHDAVRKTLEGLDALEALEVGKWTLLQPLEEKRNWPAAETAAIRGDLTAVVRDVVRPAFLRYRDFLKAEILPVARPADKAGLAFLPGGKECYEKRIRSQTSLDRSAAELHQLGLEQVAKFRRDLSQLGGKALGTTDVAEIQKKLRGDPAMHFTTAAEVEAKAREALNRARTAIPKWFGIQPAARCEVKVMGMHEAPNSTVAYYRQPATDGSRPGYYMINTYKPESRPRYEAEALAFHEAIPGHHLQIAIAQELKNVPEFRKHQGVTAFVEGWALYTERLADDMGLYSSDTDRMGMLSYDAWRACRLVVDTGIHSMGWSRQQAIDYMKANSVLAENNIVNEVDRYITWPAQALAYKCGQLEILELRDEARARLGKRFDIRQFHDVVLKNGAVALPVLREQVEAWLTAMEAAK